jgi:hypothetical protein
VGVGGEDKLEDVSTMWEVLGAVMNIYLNGQRAVDKIKITKKF